MNLYEMTQEQAIQKLAQSPNNGAIVRHKQKIEAMTEKQWTQYTISLKNQATKFEPTVKRMTAGIKFA